MKTARKPRAKKVVEEEPPAVEAEYPVRVMAAEWGGATLFVAFPSYKTTNPVTGITLSHIAQDLGKDVIIEGRFGDAMIYHSRNKLAEMFLASGCEYCFWLDDDVVIPTGRPEFFTRTCRLPKTYPQNIAGVNAVSRLMSHKLPLVGGTYFSRNEEGRLVAGVVYNGMFNPISRGNIERGARVPAQWIGTGCMLTHRSVFEMMREIPDIAPEEGNPHSGWDFFRPLRHGVGEDQSFCARARQVGIQPMLDMGVQCMHVGYMAYGWRP